MDPDVLTYDDLVAATGKKWADNYYRLKLGVFFYSSNMPKEEKNVAANTSSVEPKKNTDDTDLDEDYVITPPVNEKPLSDLRTYSKFNSSNTSTPAKGPKNEKGHTVTENTFRSNMG